LTRLLLPPHWQTAYQAPEILRGGGYAGEAVDVWAAGVVLFVMVAGRQGSSSRGGSVVDPTHEPPARHYAAGFPPFGAARRGDWWFDRAGGGQWSPFWDAPERAASFSPPLKELLTGAFTVHPGRRWAVADCLKCAWMGAPGGTLGPEALRVSRGSMQGHADRFLLRLASPPTSNTAG